MQTIVEVSPAKENEVTSLENHDQNANPQAKGTKTEEVIEMNELHLHPSPHLKTTAGAAAAGLGLESSVANNIFLSVAKEALDSYYKSRTSDCKQQAKLCTFVLTIVHHF